MAKKRNSIFNTDTSKQEAEREAKAIEKKALTDKPSKKAKTSGKQMHLYVDEAHHREAKLQALKMGMKLGEYIEWLIEQHNP